MATTRSLTDLTIDETRLDEELSHQAQYYLMAAEKAIRSESAFKEFKLQSEQLEAGLYQRARENIKGRGEKPTEKMVEQEVIVMPDYVKAQGHLNKLYTDKEVMRALKEAWYMRKDLLIQVAIKQRCELENLMNTAIKSEAA